MAVIGLFAITNSFAQFNPPDYKKIEKAIKKKNSDFYYPNLMERFIKADSTLTAEQRKHLYYGFTFQPEYSPYGSSDYLDSLRVMWSKEKLTENDWKHVAAIGDSILADNPFDLRAINAKLNAFEKLENKEDFDKSVTRMTIILDALLGSGDGRSKKTAIYVISVSHEYDILGLFELQSVGQSLVEHYDYIELADNSGGVEGLYFDITPCMKHLSSMFKK